MSTTSIARFVFCASAPLLLAACDAGPVAQAPASATLSGMAAASAGNTITGTGLPNPAPNVTRNWGQLPAGRSWGTTAGIDDSGALLVRTASGIERVIAGDLNWHL